MSAEGPQAQAIQRAKEVKQAYEQRILTKANVIGLGVGLARRGGQQLQEVGLIVFVTHKLPRSMLAEEDLIPGEIEGVPVDVQAVGEVKAQEGERG